MWSAYVWLYGGTSWVEVAQLTSWAEVVQFAGLMDPAKVSGVQISLNSPAIAKKSP
jgi:hypothetical protein